MARLGALINMERNCKDLTPAQRAKRAEKKAREAQAKAEARLKPIYHKYTGVTLKRTSNKYVKIMNIDDIDNTYIIFCDGNGGKIEKAGFDSEASITYSANKQMFIVKPVNSSREKPYFFKAFATIDNWDAYYTNDFIIVKPYFEEDKLELAELAKGCDDVWNLATFNEAYNKQVRVGNDGDEYTKDFEIRW